MEILTWSPRRWVNRARELGLLTAAAASQQPIVLLHGPFGVGKRALVAHWAQRAASFFSGKTGYRS